jgi:hypothetical protein
MAAVQVDEHESPAHKLHPELRTYGLDRRYNDASRRGDVYGTNGLHTILDLPETIRAEIIRLSLPPPRHLIISDNLYLPALFSVSYNIRHEAWAMYAPHHTTWEFRGFDMCRDPFAVNNLHLTLMRLGHGIPPSQRPDLTITLLNVQRSTLAGLTSLIELATRFGYCSENTTVATTATAATTTLRVRFEVNPLSDDENDAIWREQVGAFGAELMELGESVRGTRGVALKRVVWSWVFDSSIGLGEVREERQGLRHPRCSNLIGEICSTWKRLSGGGDSMMKLSRPRSLSKQCGSCVKACECADDLAVPIEMIFRYSRVSNNLTWKTR